MEAPSGASLTELLRRAPQACSGIVAISDNGDVWRVKPVDGNYADTTEINESNRQVGDTLIANGNVCSRVTAIVRLPRIAEFVDEPLYGVLEVEPLEVEPL